MRVQIVQLCSKITRAKQQQKQKSWLHISQGKAIYQPRQYCQEALSDCMNKASDSAFDGFLCNRPILLQVVLSLLSGSCCQDIRFNSVGKQTNLQFPELANREKGKGGWRGTNRIHRQDISLTKMHRSVFLINQ